MSEPTSAQSVPSDDFDFSTPEGQRALHGALDVVMEIRAEMLRKTALYERTLGLAVVPVLVRRAAIAAYRRMNRAIEGDR